MADTSATLSDAEQIKYDNQFLLRAKEEIKLEQFAEKKQIGKNEGNVIDFYRYLRLTPKKEPLANEDAADSAVSVSDQNLQATIEPWGEYGEPTMFLSQTTRDAKLKGYTEVFGDQMAESYDLAIMSRVCLEGLFPMRADNDPNYVATGTMTGDVGLTVAQGDSDDLEGDGDDQYNGGRICFTARDGDNYAFCRPVSDFTSATGLVKWSDVLRYSGGSGYPADLEQACTTDDDFTIVGPGGLATGDTLGFAEVSLILRTLRANLAKPIKNGYYAALIDPYVEYDMMQDTDWKDLMKYKESQQGMFKGEFGKLMNIAFIRTTQPWRQSTSSYQYSESGAVHCVPVLGKQTFATVGLAGQGKHMIVKTPGPNTISEPLDMKMTVGWKFTFASVVLNAMNGVVMMCGATA